MVRPPKARASVGYDRRLVDSLLAPKLAATSATRFAHLVHDGARTDLVTWGENTTRSETAIGKVGLDLGPVVIDEVLTVFVQRPEEIVMRYAPEEGRTKLAKLPAAAVAMALDDAAIYVAVAGGRVLRVARTGGPPEELLAGLGAVKALASTGKQLLVLTDVVRPVGLGLDASWIYGAERGPASSSGRVRHIERAP